MPKAENVTASLPKFSKKTFEILSAIIAKEAGELAESEVKKNIKAARAIASKQLYNSVTSDIHIELRSTPRDVSYISSFISLVFLVY